jgi:hypothetical protein
MPLYRSLLFAPGNHARRVEKAFTVGADSVILDLGRTRTPPRKSPPPARRSPPRSRSRAAAEATRA